MPMALNEAIVHHFSISPAYPDKTKNEELKRTMLAANLAVSTQDSLEK